MDIHALDLALASFEKTLDTLYIEMLDLTGSFINLGRAIGGLGALLYIGAKVWSHIARAEPIDVFPLLRPFAIGLALLFFKPLCADLRGVTLAISHGTDAIRNDQQTQIADLMAQKQAAIEAHPGTQDFATNEAYEAKLKELGGVTGLSQLGQQTSLTFQRLQFEVGQQFRAWIKELLELCALAARLGISLLSTFLLIMLSVAGPLAFGIAVLPGFGQGIHKWLGHFLTISLWVPVANIYSSIIAHLQIIMLQNDIAQISKDGSLEAADIGYLCFLVLAIAGYLLVPRATDMLIAASGASGAATAFVRSATGAANMAGAGLNMAERGVGAVASRGATGVGAVVGAGLGIAGAAGMASPTRGEQMGYQAGTAARARAQGLINRFRG